MASGKWKLPVLGATLLFVLAFAESSRKAVELKPEPKLEIAETESKNLISSSEMTAAVTSITQPDGRGSLLRQFNTQSVEEKVLEDPFVYEAHSYKTLDGQVVVKLEAQEPILRIINANNMGYYLNKFGQKFKLSEQYAAPVLVATGAISEEVYPTDTLKTEALQELYAVTQFIQKDQLLSGLVGQLHYDDNGDITLITRNTETQRIIIGKANNLKEKIEKLKAFYTKVLSVKGWDKYKVINLKYNNQIVAK